MKGDKKALQSQLDDIKDITSYMSDDEKLALQAQKDFLELPVRTRSKYLKIYSMYTHDDKSEFQISSEMNISIGVIRRALHLIGDQVVAVVKNRNMLVPQLEKIRVRKQKINRDIEKLDFIVKRRQKGTGEMVKSVSPAIADSKIKYYAEMRKLDELENKVLGLLKAEIVIDKSRVVKFISNYDRPGGGPERTKEKNITPLKAEPIPELPV